MADKNSSDFLGEWTGAINKEIKKASLLMDPRVSSDPNAEYLVSYLPFDKSVSEDVCGNIWEVSGNPTISDGTLSVNNSDKKGSLILPSFTLGGQDFTIGLWVKMEETTPDSSLVLALDSTTRDYSLAEIERYEGFSKYHFYLCNDLGGGMYRVVVNNGEWMYFEIDYTQSTPSYRSMLRLFNHGQIWTSDIVGEVSRQNFRIRLCDNPGEYGTLIGNIDEFKIYDGVALHTADFTPPTRAA